MHNYTVVPKKLWPVKQLEHVQMLEPKTKKWGPQGRPNHPQNFWLQKFLSLDGSKTPVKYFLSSVKTVEKVLTGGGIALKNGSKSWLNEFSNIHKL